MDLTGAVKSPFLIANIFSVKLSVLRSRNRAPYKLRGQDADNILFDIRFRLLLGKTKSHTHTVALHFHYGLAVLINQFQFAFILHDSPPSSPR